MSRFSDVNKVLERNSEDWIAYLHGQQFDNLAHLKNSQSRISGVFLRSVAFFYQLLRLWLRSLMDSRKKNANVDFYIYAGTANQANSLVGTAKSLAEKNKVIVVESNGNKSLNGANDIFKFYQIEVKLSDVFLALRLFVYNAPKLYSSLKRKDSLLISQHFNVFCQVYIYLPLFYRLLNEYKPDCVIVSNDHNVDCRSLLAMANYFGIKTAYMQHASVSDLFPALTVDYAFLDGESALETYLKCERNLSFNYTNREHPKIFLSGQKKILKSLVKSGKENVGLAINILDNIDGAIELVNKLTADGFLVSLRWHPSQKKNDIMRIKEEFSDDSMVTLSDPRQQSVDNFLFEIYYMICGNSSIHLEAAVAGVIPIYYEIQPPHIEDYYGYVKNGIALKAESYQRLVSLLKKIDTSKPNSKAIQYYSATYNTEWYGKEGELVATILSQLQEDSPWRELFGARTYSNDHVVIHSTDK